MQKSTIPVPKTEMGADELTDLDLSPIRYENHMSIKIPHRNDAKGIRNQLGIDDQPRFRGHVLTISKKTRLRGEYTTMCSQTIYGHPDESEELGGRQSLKVQWRDPPT